MFTLFIVSLCSGNMLTIIFLSVDHLLILLCPESMNVRRFSISSDGEHLKNALEWPTFSSLRDHF